MLRNNSLRSWCLIALLTLPDAAWGGEAGKLKILLLGDSTTIGSVCRQVNPDGPHLEDVIRLLLAAEKDLPPAEVINQGRDGEFIRGLLSSGRYDKEIATLRGVDYVKWVKPFVQGGQVVVLDNRLDAHFRELPGWFGDRHPSPAGYHVIGDESARFLAKLIREKKITVGDVMSDGPAKIPAAGLEYIDTSFENASPLWYEAAPDGTVLVHLLYDHERSSPNRAAGHFHCRLHARTGSTLTLEFRNLDNVWNGKKASVADELKAAVVSPDGRAWKSVPLERLPENRVRLTIAMPGPELYVARVEPYRLSDTWFTEGSTKEAFRNIGTLGEGWLERFGIDAVVHELNVNWIAGLKDYPSGEHWMRYGEQLGRVFYEYFDVVKP